MLQHVLCSSLRQYVPATIRASLVPRPLALLCVAPATRMAFCVLWRGRSCRCSMSYEWCMLQLYELHVCLWHLEQDRTRHGPS